jgi:HAD superfamily hydrolase (TIGR01509 family)
MVGDEYVITKTEHLSSFDGRSTYDKLRKLTEDRGLPVDSHDQIWECKQRFTREMLDNLPRDERLVSIMMKLRDGGFKVGVCSNSIRRSVIMMLSKLGVMEYMDFILSNSDVRNPKPHPEIYWKAMSMMGCLPEETLIFEDSPAGLVAANRSRAKVARVPNPMALTYQRIMSEITERTELTPKWKDDKLNVLIPMAGAGSRFFEKGYTTIKPLIPVRGKPMIQKVVENLNLDANFIFIVQREHAVKYDLERILGIMSPNCTIVMTDGLTEGAACTTLLARTLIDNDDPLLIANSDQIIDWDSNDFMYSISESGVDASILTFEDDDSKWSFAKTDENGFVTEVAEKKVISNKASVGIYYWARGSDYVRSADQMIDKNVRTNNEFYVCPVFNEAIINGLKVKTYDVDRMWGIGTPEDLEAFLGDS